MGKKVQPLVQIPWYCQRGTPVVKKKQPAPESAVCIGRSSNLQVLMNGAEVPPGGKVPAGEAIAVPTCDPADRAHDFREVDKNPTDGFLKPTVTLPKDLGEFRRYHPDHMVVLVAERKVKGGIERRVRGLVSFETKLEKEAEHRAWLEAMELVTYDEPESGARGTVGAAIRVAMAVKESRRERFEASRREIERS